MPRPPPAGSCGRSPSTTPEPPSPRSWRRCGPGSSVVLTSDDADLRAAGDRPVLPAIAEAAGSVIAAAVRAGATRRVIVCGGDTSSRVIRLLGVESLSIAANPWGNVVLLRAHAADSAIDGLELLLKGGQVGAATLFSDVATLGA